MLRRLGLINDAQIIDSVARITRKRSSEIEVHLSLKTLGLTSSFGLSALRSLIERTAGLRLPPLNTNTRVGELIELARGAPAPAGGQATVGDPPSHTRRSTPSDSCAGLSRILGLGMDLQEVSAMPVAADLRSDEFYVSHFSPSEISSAILRPDPRIHLCGVFCAKEAAKKSSPDLLDLRMTSFIVHHDSSGRPALDLLEGTPQRGRYRFVLTITHTAQVAAATCLTLAAE
jgi:holo-[acyl-carrier protein] synthase